MDKFQILVNWSQEKKDILYFHKLPTINDLAIGLGSIYVRLIVGLNLSICNNYDFEWDTSTQYTIDKCFEPLFNKRGRGKEYKEVKPFRFIEDIWNSQHKYEYLYPSSQIVGWENLSRYQWNSILAYCICGTPTAKLAQCKEEFKSRVNWKDYEVTVGLHIRRGDKTTQNPFIPLDVYYLYLEKFLQRIGDKKIGVYIASDDERTYEEFSELINYEKYKKCKILWDEKEKRYNNCNGYMVRDNPELLDTETETGSKIISLLGDCNYVIGMSTAHFTWLGCLLSSFNQGLIEENFYSIDPFTYREKLWSDDFK